MYQIQIVPKAKRQLKAIPRQMQTLLKDAIRELSETPRPQGVKKLSGEDNLYRIRIRNYRVIYKIEDNILLILIVAIGHRRDIYR